MIRRSKFDCEVQDGRCVFYLFTFIIIIIALNIPRIIQHEYCCIMHLGTRNKRYSYMDFYDKKNHNGRHHTNEERVHMHVCPL